MSKKLNPQNCAVRNFHRRQEAIQSNLNYSNAGGWGKTARHVVLYHTGIENTPSIMITRHFSV